MVLNVIHTFYCQVTGRDIHRTDDLCKFQEANEALLHGYSTEELSQEMANLEGLMKDLSAITANQFNCWGGSFPLLSRMSQVVLQYIKVNGLQLTGSKLLWSWWEKSQVGWPLQRCGKKSEMAAKRNTVVAENEVISNLFLFRA